MRIPRAAPLSWNMDKSTAYAYLIMDSYIILEIIYHKLVVDASQKSHLTLSYCSVEDNGHRSEVKNRFYYL
jgi:hypothetical protein